jgi:hypothetical protein
VILDNLSTHKTRAVADFLEAHPHVHVHFTPTYASWLNQVELWSGRIERDLLTRGIFTSVKDLARQISPVHSPLQRRRETRLKYCDPSAYGVSAAPIKLVHGFGGSVAIGDGGTLTMTLRESLDGDGQRIYEQIDALLDGEDGLLVLFDGARMVSYAQGFGVSPCQLELLSVEIERAVRNVVAGQPNNEYNGQKES